MIALLLAAVVASTPISLDQVREQSRRNTQTLLSELDAYRATQGIRTSRSVIYPQLALSSGITARPGQSNEATVGTSFIPGAGYDLSLTLSQLIYDGGKWWNRIEQSGAQAEAARGQYQEQQLASEFEGVRRFFELYRAQRQKEVLEANVKRSSDQVERAQGLFEGGRAGKGDLIAAKVNLGNDQLAVVRQSARIVNTQSDLSAWLARPAGEALHAEAPTFSDEQLPPFEAALELARKNRPLYRSLEAQVRAASANERVVRGDYLPRVGASVQGLAQGPSTDPITRETKYVNTYVTLGLNVRWDIFNGFVTDAQSDIANAQVRSAELNLKQALLELESNVKQAAFAVETQVAATKIAQANRELAAEGLRVAEGKFASGTGSTLEVRDAQLKLTQAELTLLETQIDAEVARANLDRVLGSRMTGANP